MPTAASAAIHRTAEGASVQFSSASAARQPARPPAGRPVDERDGAGGARQREGQHDAGEVVRDGQRGGEKAERGRGLVTVRTNVGASDSCSIRPSGIVSASQRAAQTIRASVASALAGSARYVRKAPAVKPNIAMLIVKNAR